MYILEKDLLPRIDSHDCDADKPQICRVGWQDADPRELQLPFEGPQAGRAGLQLESWAPTGQLADEV